jgi:uncharacterized protein
MRVGVESYGLKALEPVFGFHRDAEIRGATGSLNRWQTFQASGDEHLLREIADYNEDDCRSTLALRDWLMGRRAEAETHFEIVLGALQPEPERDASERQQRYRLRLASAAKQLLAGLPEDDALDDEHQRPLRLAFDLVGYHDREAKPEWWEHFARMDASVEDLRDNDSEALADLTVTAPREDCGSAWQWPMAFPRQQHKLSAGSVWDRDADYSATIVVVDDDARTLLVRRSKRAAKSADEAPQALLPSLPIPTEAQVDGLFRFADRLHDHGLEPCGSFDAATDLLLRRAPRFAAGTPPLRDGPVDLAILAEQVLGLERSALVVQGPPGTGKTYTGADLAVRLIDAGRKVGVMATSHKAIVNLLGAIDEAADRHRVDLCGWKKPSDDPDNNYQSDRITSSRNPPKGVKLDLIAGTAWLWAREDHHTCVDVLIVDEAGQVSLADAVAVSQGSKSIVLLGDPQQLAHVSQGTHRHGSGASILQHLLGEHHTVADDRGVLLRRSHRMHPSICEFVSTAMYDGKLESIEACAAQRVSSLGLTGTGLRLLPVEHDENRQTSDEEVEAIAAQVALLLDGGHFTDAKEVTRALRLDDLLVVAPYNAQVRRLRAALPRGARVGTVDKFQGQQAPVVFFSMTSSSGDDVPRGMDFLFSANRLNVAVSRAQALAVVVCSPKLMATQCRTVEQMRLVNLLCRFADAAQPVAV